MYSKCILFSNKPYTTSPLNTNSLQYIDTNITSLRAYARPLRGRMYVARFAHFGGCLINVARCAHWLA